MRPVRRLSALVLAVLALACTAPGSSLVPNPSTAPSGQPTPPVAKTAGPSASGAALQLTPWQEELAEVAVDGAPSLDSALKLFAMAFGPVPGVDVQTAAKGSVGSASPAVRIVRTNRDKLTADQRAAVDTYLTAPVDEKVLDIPPVGETGLYGALALTGATDAIPDSNAFDYGYSQLEEEVIAEASHVRMHMATYWGDMPNLQVHLWNGPNEPFLTFFNTLFGAGGFEKCDVIVNVANANDDRFQTRRSMALDIVHCFQSWKMGSEAGLEGRIPPWAWEGPAEYVLLSAYPPTDVDRTAWLTYVRGPEIPLFSRTYDAVGYWTQLQWSKLNLADAMASVLVDADSPTLFANAGTADPGFTDSWASQQARVDLANQEWGPNWAFSGSSIPSEGAPRQSLAVATGTTQQIGVAPYANRVYDLQAAAELVHFQYPGSGRLGDGSVDTANLADAWFCTTSSACQPCDDGTPLPFQATPLLTRSIFGASGSVAGVGGAISGHAKEEFCKPSPPPSPPDDNKDKFCQHYRAMLDWMTQNAGIELTQPWAAEIARRATAMRPYAPPQLVDDVDVYIRAYGTFATAPEPYNVPFSGPDAAFIGIAFNEMNAYCGIVLPGN